MQKILISACLLGNDVTYDGRLNLLDHPLLARWLAEGRLVSVCPEMAGGLPARRPAAYIVGGNGAMRVLTKDGSDVTAQFVDGAHQALVLVKQHNIKIAIMKERSPSCGSHEIYAGDFSGKKIPGNGVTAALLKKNGVTVFSENEIDQAGDFLSAL